MARRNGAPHGSGSRYNYGCRCDVCRDARNSYAREYRNRPENRERELEKARKWKREHRAHVREYDRQYKLRKRGKKAANGEVEIPPMPVAPYYRFLEQT